jgi:lysophospholipase L1-like esterase
MAHGVITLLLAGLGGTLWANDEPCRILALGDSYTCGQSVAPASSWPRQLAGRLAEAGLIMDPVAVIARTGWTTAELNRAITAARPHGPFALVTVQIGVNDQFRGYDPQEYRRQLEATLGSAIALAGGQAGHVVALSIPDWGVTRFAAGSDRQAIAAGIDRFNAIFSKEVAAAGARWVDVTAISRTLKDAGSALARDGLHPSPEQYTAWVEAALPTVKLALSSGPTPAGH